MDRSPPKPIRLVRSARLAGRLTLVALLWAAGPASAQEDEARRASHLLDYIAVDYPAAVRDGVVVSELEYREQIEFAGEVRSLLARLGVRETNPIGGDLAELAATIQARGSAADVASHARALSAEIRTRFGVRALPPRVPDLESGRRLYAQECTSCHGIQGRGDGPAGLGLDPAPTDFTDLARAVELSPFALYNTISFGIAGTGMVGFADAFGEAERYDLAFYVGSLAFRADAIERGRSIAEAEPERVSERVPDLTALVHAPASELSGDADAEAVVAFLRSHPEFLRADASPLQAARRLLAESWSAFGEGDTRQAVDLAVAAYIEGYEPVEPSIDALDRDLRIALELEFLRYRGLLRRQAPRDDVEPVYASLRDGLAVAERRLESEGLGASAVFIGALTILAREGLEALLVVVALCGVLIRAERRDALRYVHAGWIAALLAGAATWYAAQELVRISGAQREVIEGLSSLIATAILFYVSYWLISKLQAERWQQFIHAKLTAALSRGSLWTLAAVSFIAVYRELLETVLFYQALWAQTGPAGMQPLVLGIAAGAALLAVLAALVFYFGLRLPVRHFFSLSSGFLYALAIILAGQGIAALQEANWLPATVISDLRIEWLGIYGTVEGLALQGALVAAALATVPRLLSNQRRSSVVAKG
jgi:high-affinity iron transporter